MRTINTLYPYGGSPAMGQTTNLADPAIIGGQASLLNIGLNISGEDMLRLGFTIFAAIVLANKFSNTK